MTNATSESFYDLSRQAAGILASGWSEAASTYSTWLASAVGQLASESQKFEMAAKQLGSAFDTASANATAWADAAKAAGDTGIAKIMEKYAEKFAEKAGSLQDGITDAKSAIGKLADEASSAMRHADGVMGGATGRMLGPVFDAAQMLDI